MHVFIIGYDVYLVGRYYCFEFNSLREILIPIDAVLLSHLTVYMHVMNNEFRPALIVKIDFCALR